MAKVSDFKYLEGFTYPKLDRHVMEYDESNYKDLLVMLKAAKKMDLRPRLIERVYQRFNKLRVIQERKELFK